jgi:hypothetical protein
MTHWLLILALCSTCIAQVAPPRERVVTPEFLLANGAAVSVAALDVALTQRCIRANTCHERDPLFQGSAGRQYAVALGTALTGTLIDYEMERHGHPQGRVIPWMVVAGHSIGVGVAFRF